MARADLILDLVKNSLTENRYQFKKIVEAMIAEERAKNHLQLADKLQAELELAMRASDKAIQGRNISNAATAPIVNNYLQEWPVHRSFDDLILPDEVRKITDSFVEEQYRSDILRTYGLEPRHKIMLVGEPGTGKTSYAEALSDKLMMPLYVVRYDALIGSYLGETAMRLRQLFDFVSTRKCILFFDEFDTIGKERGDTQELGEIKRVVSSLLMMTDSLPSYNIILGASNHPELLDRAVWRRFQIRLKLPMPGTKEIELFLMKFEKKYNISFNTDLKALATNLSCKNFADIENFALSVSRRYILNLPEDDMARYVKEELKELSLNVQGK